MSITIFVIQPYQSVLSLSSYGLRKLSLEMAEKGRNPTLLQIAITRFSLNTSALSPTSTNKPLMIAPVLSLYYLVTGSGCQLSSLPSACPTTSSRSKP
jgi:hypothetical protein